MGRFALDTLDQDLLSSEPARLLGFNLSIILGDIANKIESKSVLVWLRGLIGPLVIYTRFITLITDSSALLFDSLGMH